MILDFAGGKLIGPCNIQDADGKQYTHVVLLDTDTGKVIRKVTNDDGLPITSPNNPGETLEEILTAKLPFIIY